MCFYAQLTQYICELKIKKRTSQLKTFQSTSNCVIELK